MADVKYVRSSFNIMSIYDFSCISQLLKNNVKLFGPFLVNVIFNYQSIFKYIDNGGLIHGWCFKTYKDIIERDLYGNIIFKKTMYKDMNTVVLYSMKINGVIILLKIIYIDEVHSQKHINNELITCTDIYFECCLLQLDRLGLGLLYIPEIYKNCPNPFHTICRNIEKKQLVVLVNHKILSNIHTLDLYEYTSKGWKYNSDIKRLSLSSTDKLECCFCGGFIETEAFQLPCKHIYHKECWRDVIDYNKKLDHEIKCQVCDFKDKTWKLFA